MSGAEALVDMGDGGEGWIRTSVRLRGQIYSLLPLTTRPPLHRCRQARQMAARVRRVNALTVLSPHELALACAPDFNSPPDCRNLERVKRLVRRRRWPIAKV